MLTCDNFLDTWQHFIGSSTHNTRLKPNPLIMSCNLVSITWCCCCKLFSAINKGPQLESLMWMTVLLRWESHRHVRTCAYREIKLYFWFCVVQLNAQGVFIGKHSFHRKRHINCEQIYQFQESLDTSLPKYYSLCPSLFDLYFILWYPKILSYF